MTRAVQTRDQVFKRAEELFTKAIALATTGEQHPHPIDGDAGRHGPAEPVETLPSRDAELIPANFVFNADFSSITPQRENCVYNPRNLNKFVTVNYFEYADLMLGTVKDTRVTVINTQSRSVGRHSALDADEVPSVTNNRSHRLVA